MAERDVVHVGYDPEVFEVGREQAMLLLHCDLHNSVFKYKRCYLVVCALSWFGASPCVCECETFDTLGPAVEWVESRHYQDVVELRGPWLSPYGAFGADYEIWHLVDDGELYGPLGGLSALSEPVAASSG